VLECEACAGLGALAADEGRAAEAEEMLRHALAVADFVEEARPGSCSVQHRLP